MAANRGFIHGSTIDAVMNELDDKKITEQEVALCASIIGSLWSVADSVPAGIPYEYQAAYFGSAASITALAPLINIGFINPRAAEPYIELAMKEYEASIVNDEDENGYYQQGLGLN